MGPETRNGRFWVCFGAEGKGKLWLARGENENKGKKAGIGEKGVLVLWSGVCGGKWLRWRNGGARWWLTWVKKMFFLKRGGAAALWSVEGKSGEGEERESVGWRGGLVSGGLVWQRASLRGGSFFFK